MEANISIGFTKMEKEQYRSVIRFLFLEGKTRIEIKERLDAVYGDSSPSMATVNNWFNEFARGRTSVFEGSLREIETQMIDFHFTENHSSIVPLFDALLVPSFNSPM